MTEPADTKPRFLQLHWLASYPGTLLNRDDAGLAKRLPFGGTVRGRISSQSLKRHWRTAGRDDVASAAENPWALQNLGVPMGVRTKKLVEERLVPALPKEVREDEEKLAAVTDILFRLIYGKNAKDPQSRQALFFGEEEVSYLTKLAGRLASMDEEGRKDEEKAYKKNTETLREQAGIGAGGLESALFGRMVTSDPAANRDAAVHVAHAQTVQPLEQRLDFLTAVDDLAGDEETGAAGVFDTELTSGVYYGYLVVDLALLTANLNGDAGIAARVTEHLVHLVAEVSPGAKKGSTAPYAFAELMLAEVGARQPRTLANAFRRAVPLRGDVFAEATGQLGEHLDKLDQAFGGGEARAQVAVDLPLEGAERLSLDHLAAWCAEQVRGAVAP